MRSMTLVLSFVGIAILVGVFAKLARARVQPTARTTVAQIGSVFESLSGATSEPAFVVISFNTPDRPRANEAVDLQFFKENGRVGFDWALEAARNLQDEALFLSFARDAGFQPRLMETNGVRHQRVDEGDILRLCMSVITELYGLTPDTEIELIIEGFEPKT
jgi:hypothetical protein